MSFCRLVRLAALLLTAMTFELMSSAQSDEQTVCPEQPASAGKALLERAESLTDVGEAWGAAYTDARKLSNSCPESFEAQFFAADTAWQLAEHAEGDALYDLIGFSLHTIDRIESEWMAEEARLHGQANETFRQRREEQAERIAIIVQHFVAPQILRATSQGKYYSAFNGAFNGANAETCPYEYDFLGRVEVHSHYEQLKQILEQNSPDALTIPSIPADYRLLTLKKNCKGIAEDVKMVRGAVLTALALRAHRNPAAPMPDGSPMPDELPGALIAEALDELRSIKHLTKEGQPIFSQAELVAAQIQFQEAQ